MPAASRPERLKVFNQICKQQNIINIINSKLFGYWPGMRTAQLVSELQLPTTARLGQRKKSAVFLNQHRGRILLLQDQNDPVLILILILILSIHNKQPVYLLLMTVKCAMLYQQYTSDNSEPRQRYRTHDISSRSCVQSFYQTNQKV